MKVLLAGVHFHSSFTWSIGRALERAGHDLRAFEYRTPPLSLIPGSVWRKQIMPRSLIRTAGRYRPDLLFIAKGDAIPGWAVNTIRRATRCRVVNWFPDPCLSAYPNVVAQSPYLDLICSKNREDVDRINADSDGRALFLHHAADRELHLEYDAGDDERRELGCDIAMVGSCYPHRERILEGLLDFDLRVYGPGWARSRLARIKPTAVTGLEARSFLQAAVFQSARVSLNTHHPDDGTALNQRAFDIAGSGGCQLIDTPRDFDDTFQVGADLDSFESVRVLPERVAALLSNPARREELRARARRKVAAAHTYDHRIAEILQRLGD
jgi:spore maturation protein CgeB